MGLLPSDLSNTGNIQDNFALSSCDPNISESCEDTKWDSRFKDSQGNEISQLTVESEETMQISLAVSYTHLTLPTTPYV